MIAASAFGRVEAVRALLAPKADVNVKRPDGAMALSLAAQQGHPEIVALLRARSPSFLAMPLTLAQIRYLALNWRRR